MRCSACRATSDRLRYVETHRHSGFGCRTTRQFLCPVCDSNAPHGACAEGSRYPIPSAATSAESADDGEKSSTQFCREDETAGRDRPFDTALGTRPEFFLSVSAQLPNVEGPNHEVAKAEGAVLAARLCDLSPGFPVEPGRVTPPALVGRVPSEGRS